tara:strand:+ start:1166 stop:1435 length:270 start_codon:yes stop_codon:yes gene_type:complete
MDDVHVEIRKHNLDAGEIRAILKNHKPVEVKCWFNQDGDAYEYITLCFNLVGTEFTLFSTHKEEDNWKQFISDARLKSVSKECTQSCYR